MAKNANEWAMPTQGYANWCSPTLNQINTRNAKNLAVAW